MATAKYYHQFGKKKKINKKGRKKMKNRFDTPFETAVEKKSEQMI